MLDDYQSVIRNDSNHETEFAKHNKYAPKPYDNNVEPDKMQFVEFYHSEFDSNDLLKQQM